MEISYDKDADALYIKFIEGVFSKNHKVDDSVIIDYDDEGKILGIELLDVKKNLPGKSLSELSIKDFLKS
jgi:uncharacterized protein YuzE